MDPMKPEDRDALMMTLTAKMKQMSDDELKDLAKELDVDGGDQPADNSSSVFTPSKPVVDTSALTGPLGALKSMLLKKQHDNDTQP